MDKVQFLGGVVVSGQGLIPGWGDGEWTGFDPWMGCW